MLLPLLRVKTIMLMGQLVPSRFQKAFVLVVFHLRRIGGFGGALCISAKACKQTDGLNGESLLTSDIARGS